MPAQMKYAAFLRGINVGGHAIIKMDNLKKIFTSAGFKNAATYIQSGNVIFDSPSKSSETLCKKIEESLRKELGYDVTVFIRSKDEITTIIKNNPFDESKLSKALILYVAFLNEEPSAEAKGMLYSFNNDIEKFIIKNREVYSLIQKNAGKTNFSPNWLEKKLKMPVTTRNWNTIKKMQELLAG